MRYVIALLLAACTQVHHQTTFQECATALNDPCQDPRATVYRCAGTGESFADLCEFRVTRGRGEMSFESSGQSNACPEDQHAFACCGALTYELRAYCRRANDEPTLQEVPE